MPCVKGAEEGTVLAETREKRSSSWVAWTLDIGTLPSLSPSWSDPYSVQWVRHPDQHRLCHSSRALGGSPRLWMKDVSEVLSRSRGMAWKLTESCLQGNL